MTEKIPEINDSNFFNLNEKDDSGDDSDRSTIKKDIISQTKIFKQNSVLENSNRNDFYITIHKGDDNRYFPRLISTKKSTSPIYSYLNESNMFQNDSGQLTSFFFISSKI